MAVLLAMCVPAAAADGLEIESFDGIATDPSGTALSQAGAHPDLTTQVLLTTRESSPAEEGSGKVVPLGSLKDSLVDLPAGLLANPQGVLDCTEDKLDTAFLLALCPTDSQVGMARLYSSNFSAGPDPANGRTYGEAAIYNMVPGYGEPAQLAFNVAGVLVRIRPHLDPSRNYAVVAEVSNASQSVPIDGAKISLWGVPGDSAHDAQRVDTVKLVQGAKSQIGRHPFISNPVSCSGPQTVRLRANSWQRPGVFESAGFLSHDSSTPPNPLGTTGCERLSFKPSLSVLPSSRQADSAAGLTVDLRFPQDESADGFATAQLRDARVTFPQGVAINPASADGLQACSDVQLSLGTDAPIACPDGATIGTVGATTPLLEQPLSGAVYLRSQNSSDPESGEMFRIALVLENKARGILVKLPGKVRVNPASGRLVAEFANNPQLPVASVSVDLKAGARAPLALPSSCGVKTTTAHLTSWSGQVADLSDSFAIPCPAGSGFAPKMSAGATSPVAGRTSPFVLRLDRADGEGLLSGLSLELPRGLTAYLKGVPYCSESAIATAAATPGIAELAARSCPAASQVGTVSVGAGAGSPFYVNSGRVYLAGPYKGAPLSLAVITPATAGPFDLGTVVVRAALHVDPETAQITAISDPLPTIVKGVPLRLRAVDLSIDRLDFTLNPTSCDPMSVDGTIASSTGQSAKASSRFQLANCERLAFKPKLALRLSGPTRRGAYPKLAATLTMPKGDANIARTVVALPHSEFLAQNHIRTICTRVQYAAKACPRGSIYGRARAFSPLLDKPLEGPVYLRSSSHELPDLVAALHGQIDIDLVGWIDSKNGGIRTTFATVPDAPVSKFVLSMKGGKKGLLENSRNLCGSSSRAEVLVDSHSGKSADQRPLLRASCGKGAKKSGILDAG